MSISISTASPVGFGEPRQSAASVATAVSQQQGSVAVSSSAVQAASTSTDVSNQLSENPSSSVARTATAGSTNSDAATTVNGAASGDDPQELEDAVSTIKEFVQSINRDLNFSMDDSTGQVVVKVTDGTSGDVIRQIPSEEALQLAKRLQEVRSLLFEAKA